jgi:hypothetical protein
MHFLSTGTDTGNFQEFLHVGVALIFPQAKKRADFRQILRNLVNQGDHLYQAVAHIDRQKFLAPSLTPTSGTDLDYF